MHECGQCVLLRPEAAYVAFVQLVGRGVDNNIRFTFGAADHGFFYPGQCDRVFAGDKSAEAIAAGREVYIACF